MTSIEPKYSNELKVFQGLKIAIVHDWLTGYRGGEKVLEVLCQLFPEAPLYTLVHVRGSVPATIEDRKLLTSFIQKLPFGKSKYRHFLPLFPLAAETLLNRKFDLVISTSSAVAKSVRTHGAPHWCYIHSPMRYVWDRFDDYFGPERVGLLPSRLFFAPIASGLRKYDRMTSSRVGQFVANSHFVAQRVQNSYGRGSEVIAPPVDTEKFANVVRAPKDYYLFFSALVPYKKADLAIRACQRLGRRLVVVGHGPELAALQKLADPKWIEFVPKATDQEILRFYSEARALIFPAIEDFGIVPVEATASGLPVIGLRQGGLLDSQTEETCVFFNEQTEDAIITAIKEFEKNPDRFDPRILREQASFFSQENFKSRIIQSLLKFAANPPLRISTNPKPEPCKEIDL